jgi:hypothetical protein
VQQQFSNRTILACSAWTAQQLWLNTQPHSLAARSHHPCHLHPAWLQQHHLQLACCCLSSLGAAGTAEHCQVRSAGTLAPFPAAAQRLLLLVQVQVQVQVEQLLLLELQQPPHLVVQQPHHHPHLLLLLLLLSQLQHRRRFALCHSPCHCPEALPALQQP